MQVQDVGIDSPQTKLIYQSIITSSLKTQRKLNYLDVKSEILCPHHQHKVLKFKTFSQKYWRIFQIIKAAQIPSNTLGAKNIRKGRITALVGGQPPFDVTEHVKGNNHITTETIVTYRTPLYNAIHGNENILAGIITTTPNRM